MVAMLKTIFKISLLSIAFGAISSCSEADKIVPVAVTCNDGIQNGDETGIDCGGSCFTSCIPQNNLQGVLVTRLVLRANVEYKLTGPFIVRDGAILEMEAGTIIKVLPGKNAYIAIAQGGKLFIWGNENSPVVITSNASSPAPGDWGGIVICGKSPTNNGVNARSELADIFYGGTDNTLSSGVIRYLRIEYSGANFSNSKRFNALSFYGVGSYTTIENIQAYKSLGNGFEIIGGTINAKQLISINTGDQGIKISGGWNGTGNSWYVSDAFNSGIELGNNQRDLSALPLSSVGLSNISIMGPLLSSALHYTYGGGMFNLTNIYTSNIKLGIKINSAVETQMLDDGNLSINNIEFNSPSTGFSETNYTGTTSFYTIGNNTGAGNKGSKPDWANGWSIGF